MNFLRVILFAPLLCLCSWTLNSITKAELSDAIDELNNYVASASLPVDALSKELDKISTVVTNAEKGDPTLANDIPVDKYIGNLEKSLGIDLK